MIFVIDLGYFMYQLV